MSIKKKTKKKDKSSLYLELDNGKKIKIRSIDNYFDPEDEKYPRKKKRRICTSRPKSCPNVHMWTNGVQLCAYRKRKTSSNQ